jgi:phosphoribosylformylglycinamidine (FGAM) synthase-like enzyme
MDVMVPKILDCNVTDCAYNNTNECHAAAITVGDKEPMCDTFTISSAKAGIAEAIGGVGACKVADCAYNDALECTADGIHVGTHSGHADCMTFTEI